MGVTYLTKISLPFSMVTSPETNMLQVGDRILEVNGTPVAEKSLDEVRSKKRLC